MAEQAAPLPAGQALALIILHGASDAVIAKLGPHARTQPRGAVVG